MATTFVEYTGDGNATKQFTFPSYQQADIKVTVDGVAKTAGSHFNITSYTTTGGGNVVFTSGNIPSSPALIRIFRDTDVDSAKATFTAGSSVKAADLNNNITQLLYAAQEEQNQPEQTADIRDDAVTTAKIKDANVTTAKIADDAVTTDKLANSINTEIAANTAKVTNATHTGDVTGATSLTIAQDAVTTSKIAADAVVGAKIADNAIDSEHYTDGSIDTEHIANDAVTAAKLADTSVTAGTYNTANITVDAQGRITSASAGTANVVDGQITTAKIADDAVTTDKLANSIVSDITANNAKVTNVTTNLTTTTATDSVTVNSSDGTNATIGEATSSAAGVMSTAHHDKLDGIEAGAKDDQTASEIKTLLQSDKLTASEIATGALDGRYYTETESDARYFNVSSGDTITSGVSFADNDDTIATTKAINARIIDLVEEVGGFVPIANETSFPTSNPDVNNGTGTIVSVSAASTNLVPSGTTVTIANGRGSGLAVIITGVSSTIPSGFGFLVETTTTAHTYTFHRLVPKATEVTTVATNATNIAAAGANTTNINAVKNNETNINTVAGISGNVTTVAGVASNVTTVAGISSDVTAVAADATDIGAVAGKATEIGRLGTADAVADLNTLGTTDVVNDMNTLATSSNVSNMNTVAGSIANVNTAASNISNVNNFANTYQIASSNPSTDGGGNSLAAGDLYFNTSSNELKVYNGSAWQGGVTATGNLASLSGANTFTNNNTFNGIVEISSSFPKFKLTDTNANSDYTVDNLNGTFRIVDESNNAARFTIASDGTVDVVGNLDVGAGVDVTGNITVSGTVDGVDIASLNSTVSGITSNATHTGEVTGSGALTIADNVVDEANLKVSNSPTNGYFLQAQSGNTGGLTWAAIPTTSFTNIQTDVQVNNGNGIYMGSSYELGLRRISNNSVIRSTSGDLIIETYNNAPLELRTNSNGTNKGVDIDTSGNLLPSTDSQESIGSNTVRFANGYFDTLYGDGSNLTGIAAGVTSDSQNNTVAGTNAGNSFSGTDAASNTLYGYNAGAAITTGDKNTLIGNQSGDSITTGNYNIGVGSQALEDVTTGSNNVAVGNRSLERVTTSSDNTAVGYRASLHVTSGQYNTSIGGNAGFSNNTGSYTTCLGYQAGYTNTVNSNTFIGAQAGFYNNGADNLMIGALAGYNNRGDYNLLIGYFAGDDNDGSTNNSHKNVAIGYKALTKLETGANQNTAVGYQAGDTITTGANNIIIGNDADATSATTSNEVTLGNSSITKFRVPGVNVEAEDGILSLRTGSGSVAEVRFFCESSNAHYVAVKSPAHSAYSGNVSFVLPPNGGTNGYFLTTDGSGNTSWAAAGGGVDSDSDGNTAGGTNAGDSITSGLSNTSFGKDAGTAITTGSSNTFVGKDAGKVTVDGQANTGIGKESFEYLVSGDNNVAVGQTALGRLVSGNWNVGVGSFAGLQLTGTGNTALGYNALRGVSGASGDYNIGIGKDTANSLSSGDENVCIGFEAAKYLTGGDKNVAIGSRAGSNITTGEDNVAIGTDCLGYNQTGGMTADQCIAIGKYALYKNSGNDNIGIGFYSGGVLTTGKDNTFVGRSAGSNVTTGDNNLCLGDDADASSATTSNEITLGNNSITKFRIPGLSLEATASAVTQGGVFYENNTTVSSNYTITDGRNAMAAGPITIASGVTVTVGSGETLTIV
jgi:hypothetical protein